MRHPIDGARPGDPASGRLVEPVAKLLAGLEERNVLLVDGDAVAGARIAPEPGVAALYREGPETAQLDAIAAGEGGADLVEDRGDDKLDVALVEMRVPLGKPLDKFRLRHWR